MPILTPEERIGTLVADRYRFESVLARGGMSVLFAGSDVRTHRPVVLKLLRPHDAIDEAKIARFLQETRTTALLRHPYVVDVDHVRVAQERRRARLLEEAGDLRLVDRVVRAQELEHDRTVRAHVRAGEEHAHPAPGEHTLEAVPVRDERPDPFLRGENRHRTTFARRDYPNRLPSVPRAPWRRSR